MTQHTQEPWEVLEGVPEGGGIAIGPVLDTVGHIVEVTFNGEEAEANAQRIVACINACQGLNPEGVGALLEAAEKASWHLMTKARRDPEEREIVYALRDAIADVKREG